MTLPVEDGGRVSAGFVTVFCLKLAEYEESTVTSRNFAPLFIPLTESFTHNDQLTVSTFEPAGIERLIQNSEELPGSIGIMVTVLS